MSSCACSKPSRQTVRRQRCTSGLIGVDRALTQRIGRLIQSAGQGASGAITSIRKRVRREYEGFCARLGIAAYPVDNAREHLFMLELRPASSATSISHMSVSSINNWRSALVFLRVAVSPIWPEHQVALQATEGTIFHALMARPPLAGTRSDLSTRLMRQALVCARGSARRQGIINGTTASRTSRTRIRPTTGASRRSSFAVACPRSSRRRR